MARWRKPIASPLSKLPAATIDKFLRRARRRPMRLIQRMHQFKIISELVMQLVATVFDDFQPAAFRRPVRPERRNDYVAARFQQAPDVIDVFVPGGFIGQEMKGRSVVPEIERLWWQLNFNHIGFDPSN